MATLEGAAVLDGGALLPGFSAPIAAFFVGLPPRAPRELAEPPSA